jgi:AcrR family transcriptional regulator
MVAHYYESKQEIILAALRLMLTRIEARLIDAHTRGESSLLDVLTEALPVDAQRFTECAFWMAFWGQVSADKQLRRLNVWVHREYMRLFARCFAVHWPQSSRWPKPMRDAALKSVVTFVNGLTASAVTSPADWPAQSQIAQLRLQLELLEGWAESGASSVSAAG